MTSAPPMVIDPYDKSTFWGRMIYFHALINPIHMFRGTGEIRKCEKITNAAKNGEWDNLRSMGVDERKLQRANVIVKACVHPTSQEVIIPTGRMSGFVPFNIPLSAAMTLTPPYLPYIIASQTTNQLYNAMFNYCNGSSGGGGSKGTQEGPRPSFLEENIDLVKGCGSAVVVSVGLAVGLNQWVKRGTFSPSMKRIIQTVIPYTAVASAGMANVACMRYPELKKGIPVYSDHGDFMGDSRKAARQAIVQTAISRAVLPIPLVGLPGPIVAVLFSCPLFASTATMKLITQLSVVTMLVWLGLPAAVAVFPQDSKIPIHEMEEEIKLFKDPHGRTITTANFNKGV